jgi:L-lactate utilization protein LutC
MCLPHQQTPSPPAIYEPTVRLVYSDLGLPELFAATATKNGLHAELLHPEEIGLKVADYLKSLGLNNVNIAESKILQQLELEPQLKAAGMSVAVVEDKLSDGTLVVTDCFAAVAETGSIVFRRSVGFALPPQSVVILEPRNFLPDLIDLFSQPHRHPQDLVLLSGPNRLRVLILH